MSENAHVVLDVEELRALVAEALELQVDEITDEARFDEDLGVDSLVSLEISVRLEERYGIRIDENDLSELGSFGRVSELVRDQLAIRSAA
ncbi:acyl carrier protein [Streptomyces sp. DH24]|uniref:acyl carrier protein n=1 Tax=Streptomyces sp. DH24 TaxID=3040123 RepID=UPI0024411D5F|nr:acyl carrier protein [Streptomyces sp. DH24]MDG9715357.1 acyl carrier protein [Streptomyces sp. DH24]